MPNERLQEDAATLLEGLDQQLRGIAEFQRERARLTASVTACDKRIRVTVNADGLLIDTEFAEDVSDLTYDEIAAAMTSAVQAAAAQVQERCRELMEPLRLRRARLPKLSDIIEGAPDLGAVLPPAPPAPKAPSPTRPETTESATADGRSMIADQDW
ncbi:YbaB/EbfC family nucleoid-associated protein [Nocardia blacklockiae]|uniref:YbaB/EbfC family nucleoid-associated protein n=1 Tax=Nocardia blacklockiae TaxID=480036 RepID=UPI001894C4FA|nr:YbaB/EbfC family nucleoid-associated protein [Nocardia blacklockiae]MBF6171423.1 YbaB/EbfC family nucleoid-associated protein [Nocardia blacklockiae]